MKTGPILLLIFIIIGNSSFAQSGATVVTGKIVDNVRRQPLEYATIKLMEQESGQLITGIITAADGTFVLETEEADFTVEVSFIGFVPKTISDFEIVNGKVDIGTVALSEDSETLEEVVVRGEKSQTEFKLDKRVFNVGRDLSSVGASALEILNNVPSVNVNIEGQVRLRGSLGVQILINGKPSVLTSEQGNALGTITADMIERIEVITNPSAKYDAEGTSGIINIVLKKEEKRGLNGAVTLNTGIPNNHSLGLSLNNRTEKFNLFSQLGVGHRTFPVKYTGINKDLVNNTTINSEGESDKNESFFNIILGTDYHINSQNVLSLTGHFAYELEKEFSDTEFSSFDASEAMTSQWHRNEETDGKNPKWQYELQYKKDFSDHEDHTLLFSALGSFFGKDQSSEFINTPISGTTSFVEQQQTRSDFQEAEYTYKLDYTHPFTDQFILEAGAQYVLTDVDNNFGVSNWEENTWVDDPEQTNVFEYEQKVLGVYSTGAFEGEKFGIKLGLRIETTDLSTLLVNTNQDNEQQFVDVFPSAHTSYKVMDNLSLQAGYSRRISRPGLFDLNPFFNIRNNFSISTGNPLLLPEYTDSYEVTGIFNQGPVSFNLAIYQRYTTDMVEEVTTFEDNVSLTKPMNIGTNKATGLEVNTKYSPTTWWSLNGDFNYNYFRREGAFEAASFDFDADQWSARLTTKFKLPAAIDFEIIGNYQSSYKTFQRERAGYVFADFGLRKKLMKGKTVLNLSVRDAFASRIFETESLQPSFYLYDHRLQGRFITLGISYGFGKGDAMEFSGQKRF